jgi:DNA-binding ferritin-like protein (Dps family)
MADKDLSVDEQIKEIYWTFRNENENKEMIKSLIKEICEEAIGEDASMGRDALTYDEKEHINQWLNKQRTKLNKIIGSDK